MSTVAIVLIAIGVIIVLALIYAASKRGQERKLEDRRHVAAEHRTEAESRRIEADKEAAIADEQAAGARRQAAEAEERAQVAQRSRSEADAHAEYASEVDPDADRRAEASDATHDETAARDADGVPADEGHEADRRRATT